MRPAGDADALDRLAARIGQHADHVRARAGALRSRCAAVRWRSTGAAEFRRTIERDVAALHRVAYQFDEAAAALRAHAGTVRERLAFLHAAVARVEHDLLHPGDLWADARPAVEWLIR